jgi:hypothetical protein
MRSGLVRRARPAACVVAEYTGNGADGLRHPSLLRSGTLPAERGRRLPGDDLVPDPTREATRAEKIPRPGGRRLAVASAAGLRAPRIRRRPALVGRRAGPGSGRHRRPDHVRRGVPVIAWRRRGSAAVDLADAQPTSLGAWTG